MESSDRPIIVPWDFSQVAENAFIHAVRFTKTKNREILLLHIVADEKSSANKEKELEEACIKLEKEHGKKPGYVVQTGSIFHAIGEVATERHAELIIMGTHGLKGAQKLFGSKALKVVVSSKIPFLVVQDKPKKEKMESILLPIDFKSENKEKANWIYYMARNFDTKFTIIKGKAKDSGFKRKLVSNMKYIESYLKTHNVEYELVTAEGKTSFKEEVVNYAKDNDFDVIMIMATRNIKFTDYLFGAPEQYIMSNEYNIPVMCVNPRKVKLSSGFRASGG
ncbi:universal stress protein [Bacteroidota bacterium]